VVLAVFVAGLVAGLLADTYVRQEVVEGVRRSLRPVTEAFKVDPLSTSVVIFYNNLRVAVTSFILGPTLIAPITILLTNGYVIGIFLAYPSGNVLRNLILLLPHGILEIPAILLSASLGTSLALALIHKYLLRGDVSISNLMSSYLSYFTLITLMLLAAAFVEVFVTPMIALMTLSTPR